MESYLRPLLVLAVGFIYGLAASVLCTLFGMIAALGWPLSESNLAFAIEGGVLMGMQNGLVIALVAFFLRRKHRRAFVVFVCCALLYFAVFGFLFFAVMQMLASATWGCG